jgi:hypothetical protein
MTPIGFVRPKQIIATWTRLCRRKATMKVTNSQIAKFSLVSMIGAIVLLQPVPEAHADICQM